MNWLYVSGGFAIILLLYWAIKYNWFKIFFDIIGGILDALT